MDLHMHIFPVIIQVIIVLVFIISVLLSRFYNASLDYICENVNEKGELMGDVKGLMKKTKK